MLLGMFIDRTLKEPWFVIRGEFIDDTIFYKDIYTMWKDQGKKED